MRLIAENGDQVGIVKIADAQAKARESTLDLVELVPHAKPPVCRIMDYGKHKFEQQKKKQAGNRKTKKVQLKEVKFRPTTDDNDYQVKLRNIIRFLDDGDRVKCTVRFRGREMAHQELGMDMLKRVENEFDESIVVEQRPKMEGRQMHMMLAPKKT